MRVYAPITLSVSGGLFALALLLCLLMLRVVIGPFSLGETGEPALRRELRVALFEPASLRAAPEPERVRRREQWRALLPREPEVPVVEALPDPAARELDAVIVSDARWMDDAEVAQLRAWLGSGGAALLAGWVGVRAAEDWAAGALRMARLLEVPEVARLPREASLYAAAGARGPLSAGLLPGEKTGLAPEPAVPAVALPGAELFWSDFALAPAAPAAGAERHLEVGAGRLAWLAPTPEAASATHAAGVWMAAVVEGALAWAARRPTAEILAWPEGAPYAGLLAMDSEHGFESAGGVAEAAAREGFPVTFLVLAEVAERFPELLSRLAEVGEVGSHADVHQGFEGAPPEEQRRRLESARDFLRARGLRPVSFRPPYESYDDETLRTLAEAGFAVLLGDKHRSGMAPRLLHPDGDGSLLVQIPRPVRDDYDLFVRESIQSAQDLEQALRADLARVSQAGGLYYFSFHTQFFAEPERVAALARLEQSMREEGAWLASAGAIADWWRRRDACRVAVERVGPRRLRARVTNQGDREVEGLALRIHPGAPLRAVRVSGTRVFQGPARARLAPGGSRLDLLLPPLAPRQSEAFDLDFDALPGPEPAR
jgi:peptidoglycan/xylan/chitin deacetylase (PgdA/CDA1 family)